MSPTGIVSRPGASVSFVSDGPISSNSGRNGGKNAGRNCVSALPQRATVGCDFPHLLAGITFHHRCQSKGLRVRSPARRLTRPLAPATVGVFLSYRRTSQAFPLEVRGIEWRTPVSLPLEGFAVLNDTPVACQTRGPTRRGTGAPISRRRQPPPTHCGASRRNGRDLIIATRPAYQPLPSLLSAAAAQEVQAVPRTDNDTCRTNSARSAPPILHDP